ncbi:MAG: hypothetical protein WCT04_15845 [Planctomycetota bacterium]
MFRSSIFNFESFEGFGPRVPNGLLCAVALVCCVELGVRVAPDTWLFPYYSRLGFRGFMEHEVLPKFKEPKIAIVGTSRAADAFNPKALDEALGLPEFSTVNLSIFGSRTSDWLDLYQRNRAKLSHCKLFVVTVDEWTFNSGVGNDDQFSLDAPLADRWNYAIPHFERLREVSPHEKEKQREIIESTQLKRNYLLADWVFSMRLKLGYVPQAIAKSLKLGKKRDPIFDQYHMVRSTSAESGKETLDPKNFHERIRNFYKNFNPHPIYFRHIEELARLIKEDGGRLVIVHLPNRRSYQNEVDKLFPNEYAKHLSVTQDLAKRVGARFEYRKYPEEIGLVDTDYEDYCHMVLSGTMKSTKWVAEILRSELNTK